jgi:hypothetical protein
MQRRFWATGCAGAAIVLASCAPGDSDVTVVAGAGSPAAVVRSSATSTAGVETGRAQMTMEVTVSPDPTVTMTVDVEFAGDAAHMVMSVEGIDDAAAAAVGETPFAEPLDMYTDAERMYYPASFFEGLGADLLDPGTSWGRIDVAELGPDAEEAMGGAEWVSSLDDLLALAKDADAAVSDLGVDPAMGGAHHYAFEITMSDLAAGEGMGDMLDGVPLDVRAAPVPIELWVDDDGLVSRMTMLVAIDEDGMELTERFDMRIFDLGADITVSIPALEDTTDLTEWWLGAADISGR